MTKADGFKRRRCIAAFAGFLLGLVILGAIEAEAASWTNTGALSTARSYHTATLLPSGKVLAAGGFNIGYLAGAELFDPATGAWNNTGSLNSARQFHTATLLPNGKVLVAGGRDSNGYLAGAELYDPATGAWTATGSLNTPRGYHTATLLPNGKILVAGGFNSGYLASAELYDPAANGGVGAWTATGNLNTGREWHTATLLPSGKVLVAGGRGSNGSLAGAELYDPGVGAWTATGNLNTGRAFHRATLLPNGKVLVAGGSGIGGTLASAELFDPAANGGVGAWTATGNLNTGREWHTATLLPNGKVLVAGGFNGGGTLASAELFDPAANGGVGAWTDTGSLNTARRVHTATLLPSGNVLVAGGYNGGELADAELYNPAAGAWTATGNLNTGRGFHTATLLPNGKVLAAGGSGSGGTLASTELYNPATGAWTATGNLNAARYWHTATLLPNGKILVAGGWGSGGHLASAELYNPDTGAWTATGNLNAARYWHTATLLPDGKVLVAGGLNIGGTLASAELYDPATGVWIATGNLNTARRYHTATLLPNGKVLAAGGVNSSGELAGAELYDPAANGGVGAWTATGNLTAARYAHTATLLANGKVLAAGGLGSSGYLAGAELYNPATGAWTATGNLNTARGYQTATLLADGKVLVAGGFNGGSYLAGAELYEPATGAWTATSNLNAARYAHTATLLPNGKVLAAGGADSGGWLAGAELFDCGLGYPDAWRPVLTTLTSPLATGAALAITGTGFRGYGYIEASGGATNNSASNYPLVQLRRIDSEQSNWLLPDPANPFSATSFTSAPVTGLIPGPALVTLFVNGIPSESRPIFFGSVPPAITSANHTTFPAGSAGAFIVTATGSPAPALSKAGALPAGVTFTDNGNGTATLAGTAGTIGAFNIVITAGNGVLPNATQNFTLTVNGVNVDFDNDGVRDSEEQGPDGNDPYHDGNGDRIPDWRQGNVVSFHTYAQDGSRHYLTLALPSGQNIEYVYALRTFETPPPDGVSFPYGFFSFSLTGFAAGGTTTATIYLDGTPPKTYYKYGKTPDNPQDHWYEFSYDGETGAEVVGNTVVLHFVDGKRGDHDLTLNGRVTDPGGPAEIAPHAGLYFPYLVSTGEERTEIGIINTKDYASTSTISYYGATGELIEAAALTLGPKGKAVIGSIPPNSASAVVSGDGNPLGYTRYLNSLGQRYAWPASTSLQKYLSVPHTAIDANWATALCLFNPGHEAAEVTLAYESGASNRFTLNARSRRFFWLGGAEPVTSITSSGYIAAMEVFKSLAPGGDMAALALRERYLNALYVPSILHGSGEFTGIGLKNTAYSGIVTIFGHRATGEGEEISFATQPLGIEASHSRMALDLSGLLRSDTLWAKVSGEADFTTPAGRPSLHFQGVAVYGQGNTTKLGAVSLNALKFREGFLGILSADPEPTYALLNPGATEAAITVTAYNAAGEVLAGNTVRIAAGSSRTGGISDLFTGVPLNNATHLRMVSDADLYGFETIHAHDRMEMLPVLGLE